MEVMEVPLPQTMLQKLLDLLKLESLKFCLIIYVHVILHIRYQVNMDYHNPHESAALIGHFHMTSSVLPSVESHQNYGKPTQRGVQGYLAFLQRRVQSGMPLGKRNSVLAIKYYVLQRASQMAAQSRANSPSRDRGQITIKGGGTWDRSCMYSLQIYPGPSLTLNLKYKLSRSFKQT